MTKAGYQVSAVSEENAVSQFNLQALPQLVVRENDSVLYQGGYGPDQQHKKIYQDLEIFSKIQSNSIIAEFPIFGCLNGKLRQNLFDLLGVKYGRN